MCRISPICTTIFLVCWLMSIMCSARRNINVSFQSLATEGELGYVVTDVAQTPSAATLEALRNIEGTIRMRVIS